MIGVMAGWDPVTYTPMVAGLSTAGVLCLTYDSGQNGMYTYIIWLLMIPHKISARAVGVNTYRSKISTIKWIRKKFCAERFETEGLSSGFTLQVGPRKIEDCLNGDVVGIYVHLVLGVDVRVGYGYIQDGNLITGSHVATYSGRNKFRSRKKYRSSVKINLFRY